MMTRQQTQPGCAARRSLLVAGVALAVLQMAQAKEVRIPTSKGFMIVNVPDEAPVVAPKASAASNHSARPDLASSEREIAAALVTWAKAWSKKDLDTYIAAYTPDFNGGKSRTMWEQERRSRIQSKRHIEVKLSDIKVEIKGDKALVRFSQDYKADSFGETSGKRVDMVRSGNNWLIAKESTGS